MQEELAQIHNELEAMKIKLANQKLDWMQSNIEQKSKKMQLQSTMVPRENFSFTEPQKFKRAKKPLKVLPPQESFENFRPRRLQGDIEDASPQLDESEVAQLGRN